MIEISNLSLIRDNVTILNQIQVTIQEGETWILLGRNGAGKNKSNQSYIWL
jgi:ABC-type molybdenum transport system ATPase subunit/photorepair protein PhrA